MSTDLEIRQMATRDIPAGMRLKDLEGWNQTERDWMRLLQLEFATCFVAVRDGEVCGTVAALRYGRHVGWIGMVLVDPRFRNQGIGKRLLDHGLSYLDSQGVETIKLDATPMGHSLYLSRGFADEYEIERWDGIAAPQKKTAMQQMGPEDIRRVCDRDAGLFGADRSRLLTALWHEAPEFTAVAYSGREVAGYFFGRVGRRAHYLGPWVAAGNSELAGQLLMEFLNRASGERIFVDICMKHPDAKSILERIGFNRQRTLMRMYRGPNGHPGEPSMICAISGPELG
jgi:GNAT superfamily N-acetyltransferase